MAKKISVKNDPTKTGRVLEERRCQACGKEWFPREIGVEPVQCPKCKSAYWKVGKRSDRK
jgi:predicted Zn-ribbon and HTH transcriptional regulator